MRQASPKAYRLREILTRPTPHLRAKTACLCRRAGNLKVRLLMQKISFPGHQRPRKLDIGQTCKRFREVNIIEVGSDHVLERRFAFPLLDTGAYQLLCYADNAASRLPGPPSVLFAGSLRGNFSRSNHWADLHAAALSRSRRLLVAYAGDSDILSAYGRLTPTQS